MHGLKGEETADARENTLSGWPSNFPTAIYSCFSVASNKLGRRGRRWLASIQHPLGA